MLKPTTEFLQQPQFDAEMYTKLQLQIEAHNCRQQQAQQVKPMLSSI
jgi:hypothetical protein